MQDQELIPMSEIEPSPHEATTVAELIQPFQIELIKDFCKRLKTKPAVEVAGMFGEGTDFSRLSQRAADDLIVSLRNAYVRNGAAIEAFQMSYDNHNARDHDKTTCLLCSSYGGK